MTSADERGLPPAVTAVERFAFLARAGERLAASLAPDALLRDLAALALPILGDFCIVDVVDDGALRRVATAHVDPAKAALLEELQRSYPPSADSPQPAARVIRSGALELIEDVTEEAVSSHTRDAAHADLMRAIGVRSHLAIPLAGHDGVIGALSLGVTESARRYGPDDVALAQDLARRAAAALENARLYQRVQDELAERKRAEAALRISEQRFRAVMEQSPFSTQVFAPDGTTLRVNRAWEALWGVRMEQIAGYNVLADPQLEARGIAPLIRRAFAGEAVELPAIRYDPNETIPDVTTHEDPARWVRAFAYPVKDESGAVREVVLLHEDVSVAQRDAERLRKSEEGLQLALAAGRMHVWQWDLAADTIESSDNARAFWGLTSGRTADYLPAIHPDDVARVEAAAARVRHGRGDDYLVEFRLVPPGGGVRWVQSRGRIERGPDGVARRLFGITADITELKRAQDATHLLADASAALGRSLDYRATLAELSRVVVPALADWCAVDLIGERGEIERVSVQHVDPSRVALAAELAVRYPMRRESVERLFESREPEWSPEIDDAMLERTAQDAAHLELLRGLGLRSYIRVPLATREAVVGVLTLVMAESERRYDADDVALAVELGRRAASAIENARLHQELRAEDRRKDEFLATLAHELRNPLAPLRTGIALLRRSADAALRERTLAIMDRQLTHMVRLVDDLLDLSRVTRGRIELAREPITLSEVVDAAIEAAAPWLDAAGVAIERRDAPEPLLLSADRTRLAQVVSNLLHNAAKFSPRGSRIVVTGSRDGGCARLEVRDEGIGIPAELLGGIFEMFTQAGDPRSRTQGGLGIGLTLVRRLVELHGGSTWAESDGPGRGSTFVVQLPLAAERPAGTPAAAIDPARAPPHGAGGAARRVLVVDDNADAAETLAAILALEGHEVRVAGDAGAAMHVIASFRPHIAFLDIGLPGMNGYDLARHLRADPTCAGLVLVAVTGWGQAQDLAESGRAGFDRHLTKPVDTAAVLALVRGVD